MRLRFFAKLNVLFLIGFVSLSFGVVFAQYYYFDTGSTTYPYQQGCNETLGVRINTQGDSIRGGRFHLVLDPSSFYYSTSSGVSILRSDLFNASSNTFLNRSSDGSPSWGGGGTTILQVDRTNTSTDYNGSNGLYGTIKFAPLYNVSTFNGSFGMEYVSGLVTTETTLSRTGGVEMIDPVEQMSRLTGTYNILQEPCVDDTNNPSISVSFPSNGSTKISNLNGISLSLNEAAGVAGSNVPYIRTGGGTVWTGNPGGTISNQYGINLNTFTLNIFGNGTGKNFTGGSLGVTALGNGRTWQDNDKNYSITISSGQIFDYGIEKTIQVTINVADREGNSATQRVINFNAPVSPRALGTFVPSNGAIFVNLSAPVQLGIQDDWAGVDGGSIQITLSGINGTDYGPYIFSGNDLNLTGVPGSANQPDYYINITNHVDFPASGTIKVSVYAEDMENNVDSINDYTFTTRPDCSELQCCDYIYTQIGTGTPILYPYTDLYVSYASGLIPSFTGFITGYLDCQETYYGISIYSGDGNTGTLLDQFTGIELIFSGTNIKAILTGASGNVVLLTRIGNFIVKVYPSNRVTTLDNSGIIIFYDESKNFVYSGEIGTNIVGTGNFIEEISAGTYYVVYKGQSQLSSYISGFVVVQNSGLMLLDFTTGTNLYGTQQKNLSQDDGYRYQTAGDLKNTNGVYDYMINGNDIAIIVADGLFDNGIGVLDPRNLNGDVAVNASDIAIIGINFEMEDISFYADIGFQPLFNR
ncbi:hypothetical protein K9M48_04960 [Candidatus Gracilibacteria bacterium]|nr:hypothetical protein [Candidatus Gracilibacteria bacterium]